MKINMDPRKIEEIIPRLIRRILNTSIPSIQVICDEYRYICIIMCGDRIKYIVVDRGEETLVGEI